MGGNLIGQVLLNQFRVDAFIDSGGMGAVYKVWDAKRNVYLALKTLHAEYLEDPTILKRFQREARALEKLRHPHIVPFYGFYPTEDISFLLEKYIDGESLKLILKKQTLTILESLSIIKATSAAIGYAHAHDVVHCDVKPGNIMVDQGGSIYLTDFGVARHADSTTTTLASMGTSAYIAPEQIRGEPVTFATDIYSLGVTAYEMLAGRRPFIGEISESDPGIAASDGIRQQHLTESPPDPVQLNPQLPVKVGIVLQKTLSKNPSDRFTSTQEFYQALCEAFGIPLENVPERIFPKKPSHRGETIPDDSRNRTPVHWIASILVLMLLASGLYWGINMSQAKETQVTGSPPTNMSPIATATITEVIITPLTTPVHLTPTLAPSTPTPRPRPTNTPKPLTNQFLACQSECMDDGSNAVTRVPGGTKKLYLRWSYKNIPTGAHYVRYWTMNGLEWVRYDCTWPGPKSGVDEITLTEPEGLHSGTWEVTIMVNDEVIMREQVYVDGNWSFWEPAGVFYSCYGKK